MAKASMNNFKPGDIVRLKSGGPDMTVTEENYEKDAWVCKWFGGKKLEGGQFPPESIEHVQPKGDAKT